MGYSGCERPEGLGEGPVLVRDVESSAEKENRGGGACREGDAPKGEWRSRKGVGSQPWGYSIEGCGRRGGSQRTDILSRGMGTRVPQS